jgi:ribosomal protein S8E
MTFMQANVTHPELGVRSNFQSLGTYSPLSYPLMRSFTLVCLGESPRYDSGNMSQAHFNSYSNLIFNGVKKNPQNPMYTQLGVLTKGTIIEVLPFLVLTYLT